MEFKEFKIEELFNVESSKKIFHANNVVIKNYPEKDFYPYVVRSAQNNGVVGYINEKKEYLNPKNTLSFAQDTFVVFYQNQDYFTGNKVKILNPKIKFNQNIGLFITSVFNALLKNYSWGVGSTTETIKNYKIQLPITSTGEIDFDYMEQYIEKIEKQYIEKIEKQYTEKIALMLKASGLDNYQLTEEEKAILKEEKEKKEFKIEELFETIPTNRLHYKAGDYKVKTKIADLPATTCSNSNQMLTCYVPRKGATILKNCISVTANGDATCFYQPNEFTILQDSYAIKSKNECSENVYLYFVAVLQKVLKVKYSWTNKSGWNKLKNDTILVPINSEGEIDFDYMEKYISAIIKTKIKNVVLEINKKLELYKQTQN